ncbi:MAG: RNA polymerase sigma factor [Candidatus Rokubacteria bacterium]|nr:RNA polymerase sigma factor [Candidatus Rokubacteria bacterium]
MSSLTLKEPRAAGSDRDAGLVEGLRREAREAAETLVARYGDRVWRLAFRITGNREDAEEVAQDALWTAARKISTFKGESAFGSWLYRITANTAYQKLRSRRGRDAEISWESLLPHFDETGRHAEALEDWAAKVDTPVLQGELRIVLGSAMDSLPPDYRTAFLLHDVDGLSNPEIARALGISLPAVKSRVHRSRLFLRQRLARYMAAS